MTSLDTVASSDGVRFTPGPWTVLVDREQTGFRMVRTYVVGAPDVDGIFPDGEFLAQILSTKDADEDANAHVMAAAPDLYTALEALMATDGARGTYDASKAFDAKAAAERALSRARGEGA